MKKLLLLLLLVAAFGVSVFSQGKPHKKFNPNPFSGRNGYQVSMGYLNHFEADVSYIMTSQPRKLSAQGFEILAGFHSISTGLNYAYSNGKSFIGPKTYFQATYVILTAQGGVDYLSDFKQTNVARFTPKVGISFFGYASILYGKNYALGNKPKESNDLVGKGTLHLQIPIEPRQSKR